MENWKKRLLVTYSQELNIMHVLLVKACLLLYD